QRHKDIAASIQRVTEDVMLKMSRHLHHETGSDNLCLAGGVALNCVANGKILRDGSFHNIFVQPAAGDAGGAVAVAPYTSNPLLNQPRQTEMRHAFLGPEYSEADMRGLLEARGAPGKRYERDELLRTVAQLIADQKVIGWFQGRMEFGPR